MRLVPVLSAAGFDDERYGEFAVRRGGVLHDHFDDPSGVVGLGFARHGPATACGPLAPRRRGPPVFGPIARLMMSALPLGPGPARRVGVADPGDEAFPTEDRLDIAGAAAVLVRSIL